MKLIAFGVALLAISPVVRAADTDSVDTVIHAVYDVISGPAGTRDWARFKSLFADGARVIPVRANSGPAAMTPDEYATRAGAGFEKAGFFANEISRKFETFGNIAQAFSTYESRHAAGEKPFARGINSFQLVKVGSAWKVMTIFWDSERADNPIPAKYLP
jgi:hypothetical protein